MVADVSAKIKSAAAAKQVPRAPSQLSQRAPWRITHVVCT